MDRGGSFAMPANHSAPMSATDCMFVAFSGRKLFSFLSRTIALLGDLASHEAMGEEVGSRLEQDIEVGVEVPELEHLNVAAPEHLVDVADRDAAGCQARP